ncbi:unnamed protein product [Hyaloperonospora brassicae]|uniref:RxLR effector candidate protein n=1 Tax=Hyaloperonospora brassicae TaxID=162125 RepID=A0AAV0V4W1_HYABA|nr:unnamed protein product [Hyaloperonospora brassicae]
MFEVQVVRHRRDSGARRGLQALRRCFALTVDDRYLTLRASPSTTATVLCIPHNDIKCVRVRGRLLRADTLNDGNALTVRLRDREEALRAAELMMDTWGIDPLVENSAVPLTTSEEQDDCAGLALLVKHYVNNRRFRQLVYQLHDHIDTAVAQEGFSRAT